MLTNPRDMTPQVRINSAHGFTLIELLIGMTCSVFVLGALAAVLQVTFNQSTRISNIVAADQAGRTAMSSIVEELRSSCTGFGATAIQVPTATISKPLSKLNSTNLWFISAYGSATSGKAFYTQVYEHDISWQKTKEVSGKQVGTLYDYRVPSTEYANEKWVFPELSTEANVAKYKTTLAENVIAPPSGEIFKYSKFATTNSGSAELTALTSESTIQAAAAESPGGIAKVEINFLQAPPSDATKGIGAELNDNAEMSDSVVLRLNAIESGTEGVNTPCR